MKQGCGRAAMRQVIRGRGLDRKEEMKRNHNTREKTGCLEGGLIFPAEAGRRTPQHHASTIAESEAGLVAAWFSGKREGHRDVTIRA